MYYAIYLQNMFAGVKKMLFKRAFQSSFCNFLLQEQNFTIFLLEKIAIKYKIKQLLLTLCTLSFINETDYHSGDRVGSPTRRFVE